MIDAMFDSAYCLFAVIFIALLVGAAVVALVGIFAGIVAMIGGVLTIKDKIAESKK